MNKTQILVVTHKEYQFPKDAIYTPIQVNAQKNKDLGYLKDNEGDNISFKNNNYCELTAMYWAWKNLSCDIIGINHYRRYLSTHDMKEIKKANDRESLFSLILTKDEIAKLMDQYDVVAPKTKLIVKNVYTKYRQQHHIKDLDNCRQIIEKLYPDYLEAFDCTMKHRTYYICNMGVMNKQLFDEYCEWLFNILFALEEITVISDYTPLQKRIYGFLSERLFNVWLEKNNLKTKELNMVLLEHDSFKTIVKKAYRRILGIKS